MSARRRHAWAGLLLVLSGGVAQAHPLAPALLELREVAPAQYKVLWRTTAARVQSGDVTPRLPDGCAASPSGPAVLREAGSIALRWAVQCAPGPLQGTFRFDGLERSRINVILRIETLDGSAQQVLLDARHPQHTLEAGKGSSVFGRYLRLGIEHLVTGADHLLFVGGLLLLVSGLRRLLVTVTAFTLGHSATLALATLGVVQASAAWTELGIAASLLWLAHELVRPAPDSWFRRRPGTMAAGFGLLHGLGFAGALAAVGLPHGEIPLALFGFNAGIELGQVGVIAALLVLAQMARAGYAVARGPRWVPAALVPAYVIGSLAAYWCFERGAALFL